MEQDRAQVGQAAVEQDGAPSAEKIVRARFWDPRASRFLILMFILFGGAAIIAPVPESILLGVLALINAFAVLVLLPRHQPVLSITPARVAVLRPERKEAPRSEIAAIQVTRESVDFVNEAKVPVLSLKPTWGMSRYRAIAGRLGVPIQDDRPRGKWDEPLAD